jgi:ATP-dependent exoDNAse (exonuclease V) beta subunit
MGQAGKRLRGKTGDGKVLLHRETGVAMQWENPARHTYKSTLLGNIVKYRKGIEEKAELVRLFYVALTRAMDRLVILGAVKNADAMVENAKMLDPEVDSDARSAGSFLDMILPSIYSSDLDVTVVSAQDLIAYEAAAGRRSRSVRERLDELTKRSVGNENSGVEKTASSSVTGSQDPIADSGKEGTEPSSVTESQDPIADSAENEAVSLSDPFIGSAAESSSLASVTEPLDDSNFDALYNEVAERLDYVYPHADAVHLKSKFSVSELNRRTREGAARRTYFIEGGAAESAEDAGVLSVDVLEYELSEDGSDSEKLSAAERGNALHRAMEHLDFKEAYAHRDDNGYFDAYLDGLATRMILTAAERSAVGGGTLRRFAHTDLCRRAAKSDVIRKEVPFNIVKEWSGDELVKRGFNKKSAGAASETIMIQGVIDCWFEEDGQLVLIDYKSGRYDQDKPGEELRMRKAYGEQIALYCEALETVLGKDVKEAYLYLTGSGVGIGFYR